MENPARGAERPQGVTGGGGRPRRGGRGVTPAACAASWGILELRHGVLLDVLEEHPIARRSSFILPAED